MATAAGSVVVVQGHGARRFAAACDALSRYVKAAAAASCPQQRPPVAVAVLPLMPGADLSLSAAAQEESEHAGPSSPAPASSQSQQLTISYGGQVVVLDDVAADKAAELLRAAAAAQGAHPRVLLRAKEDDDLPMARKASLQRFMEKRKSRAAARGSSSPYSRPEATASSSFPDHLALTL